MRTQVSAWWLLVFLIVGVVSTLTVQFGLQYFSKNDSILSPLSELVSPPKELPLLQYSIPELTKKQYEAQPLTITKVLSSNETSVSFLFTFQPLGRQMSGQLFVPKSALKSEAELPTIIMARGYVSVESYETGVGTRNAAAAYAAANFMTLSPDFFGYGESDPEPVDTWQGRFEKPIIMAELIKSVETYPVAIPSELLAETDLAESPTTESITLTATKIGLWGHSNGGQIVLTTLEVLKESYPTTLWAPVTAPFPYSILFFTDELEDEGKASRLWVAQFEQDYDVFDFSLSKHLDLLQGPLQLHQGTADDAVLQAWSDEFVDKIELENDRRKEEKQRDATSSALPAIDITYYTYPGADHNMRPSWDTVVARDISFFQEELL